MVHTGRHLSSLLLSKTKAVDEESIFLAGAVMEPVPLSPERLGSGEKAC